jgi:hypothetical protein
MVDAKQWRFGARYSEEECWGLRPIEQAGRPLSRCHASFQGTRISMSGDTWTNCDGLRVDDLGSLVSPRKGGVQGTGRLANGKSRSICAMTPHHPPRDIHA